MPSEVGTECTSAGGWRVFISELQVECMCPRTGRYCNADPGRLEMPHASRHGPARAPRRAPPPARPRRLGRSRGRLRAVRQPADREPHRRRVREPGHGVEGRRPRRSSATSRRCSPRRSRSSSTTASGDARGARRRHRPGPARGLRGRRGRAAEARGARRGARAATESRGRHAAGRHRQPRRGGRRRHRRCARTSSVDDEDAAVPLHLVGQSALWAGMQELSKEDLEQAESSACRSC